MKKKNRTIYSHSIVTKFVWCHHQQCLVGTFTLHYIALHYITLHYITLHLEKSDYLQSFNSSFFSVALKLSGDTDTL